MKTEQEVLSRLDTLDAYWWQERNRGWRNHCCSEDVQRIYLHIAGIQPLPAEDLDLAIDHLPPIFLKSNDVIPADRSKVLVCWDDPVE